MIETTLRKAPPGWAVDGRTGVAAPGWKGILFGLPFVPIYAPPGSAQEVVADGA